MLRVGAAQDIPATVFVDVIPTVVGEVGSSPRNAELVMEQIIYLENAPNVIARLAVTKDTMGGKRNVPSINYD